MPRLRADHDGQERAQVATGMFGGGDCWVQDALGGEVVVGKHDVGCAQLDSSGEEVRDTHAVSMGELHPALRHAPFRKARR